MARKGKSAGDPIRKAEPEPALARPRIKELVWELETAEEECVRAAWEVALGDPEGLEMLERSEKYRFAAGIGAAQAGDEERLRRLLARGWDGRGADGIGAEAAHYAAAAGQVGCLKALLEAGADPNRRTQQGASAGHYAARGWHWMGADGDSPGCLRLLLAAGLDPNAQDHDGESMGHWAARWGEDEALRILAAAGWDWRPKSTGFWSAGFCAASAGQEETLRELISLGWDPREVDEHGSTPREIAEEMGHAECASFLERAERAVQDRQALEGMGIRPGPSRPGGSRSL